MTILSVGFDTKESVHQIIILAHLITTNSPVPLWKQ